MPVRFNPPPGWQVPPGFRPDSAWAPDPSWPPAPPGWNYWVDLPAAPPHDQGAQDPPRPASAPTPPQPPASPPSPAPGDLGDDTRTVAIQVVHQGLGTQAPAPQAGPPPVDELGSTMTMAPVSGPPPAAQRPGSGAQPVYPPQSEPPPPPEPPSKGPTTGVIATLKGLGRKTSAEGSSARPGAQSRQGPGPVALSIDDSYADHGGPVPPAGVPAQNMSGPRPGAASRQRSRGPGAGIMVAIAVAGLALGVIIGVIITAGQQAEANQAITDAQNVTSEIDEARAQIEADRELVDKQRDEVAEREQALGDRERKVKEQEATLKQQQEQQEQQQQQQEQEQQEQEQEDDHGPGGGHQNGTVFYWNCDAVRAAGAAPLSSTDPGYLPHLDQNGNGVACEGGE